MTTAFDITVSDIHGSPKSLAEYKGKVLLIVNKLVVERAGDSPTAYRETAVAMLCGSDGLRDCRARLPPMAAGTCSVFLARRLCDI